MRRLTPRLCVTLPALLLASLAQAADLPLAIVNISPDSGRSASDGATSSLFVEIRGQAPLDTDVDLTIDGKPIGIIRAEEDGRWILPASTIPLAAGQHVLSARIGSGIGQRTSTFTILIDPKAPAAPTFTVVEPDTGPGATDWVTTASDVLARGRAEAGSLVQVSLDGSVIATPTATATGDWSVPLTGLAEGTHQLSALATDAAGNASPAGTKTLRVDNTPPQAPSIATMSRDTGVSPTDRITRDVTPTLGGQAEAGVSVTVLVDGTAAGTVKAGTTGAWSLTTAALPEGAHQVTAVATDAVGLSSPASEVFSLVIKTLANPPTIEFSPDTGMPDDRITSATAMVFAGWAGDGVSMSLSIDSRVIATPAVDAGRWTVDRTAYPLEAGTHAVVATATDVAGNQTAAVLNLTIDASPPVAPYSLSVSPDPVQAGQPVTISGLAEHGQRVQVSIDGALQPEVMAGATGDWLLTGVVLAAGDHQIAARTIDAAGNTGPFSGAITVHANAPVVGERITFHFRAVVAEVNDEPGLLQGGIVVGQQLNGSYSYRLGAADTAPETPTVGAYLFSEPGLGISLATGQFAFASDPTQLEFRMEMANNHSDRDNYLLRSYRNIGSFGQTPLAVEHISWQLDDATRLALSSDALTDVPPFLAHWQSVFGLVIEGGRIRDPLNPGMPWTVRAHVVEIWRDGHLPGEPIPEPTPDPNPNPTPLPEPPLPEPPLPEPGNG